MQPLRGREFRWLQGITLDGKEMISSADRLELASHPGLTRAGAALQEIFGSGPAACFADDDGFIVAGTGCDLVELPE
ncbi:MAG: hypothetical protein HKL84_07920 [Acidimicrobiaceae bacterium]|nr:hypothetical protein [Acidimicrobiaceae bacterium]